MGQPSINLVASAPERISPQASWEPEPSLARKRSITCTERASVAERVTCERARVRVRRRSAGH
eukprot:scaffold270826_cov35-Tisochrysis_lutea.AAC.1